MGNLLKITTEFPDASTSNAVMPETDRLFDVQEDSDSRKKFLDEERAQAFHYAVTQGLFITARCYHEIPTMIVFLCTRIECPDENDWGNLKHMIKYI